MYGLQHFMSYNRKHYDDYTPIYDLKIIRKIKIKKLWLKMNEKLINN